MLNKPDFIDEEQNYLLNSLLTLTQKNPAIWECVESVSYTHLTLPTIA